MNNFKQKFILYSKLPEMRLFWYFLPLVLAVFIIEIFYLPAVMLWLSAVFFVGLGIIIFINNLRLAKSNLEVKIERNELTSIIAALRDGIVAYDADFKILLFNKAAEQIFNLKSGEIVGSRFTPERVKEPRFKVFSQAFFPSLAPIIAKRTDPGAYPQIVDISLKEPTMELRVITNKIVDPTGNLLGFVKIIRDRVREVGILRSKSEFINVAANQLKAPLADIGSVFENLLKESLSESQKKIIDFGAELSLRMSKTLDVLFDVIQIEEGRFGYDFEKTDIVLLMDKIVSKAKEMVQGTGIKIYFQKPEEMMEITADPRRLNLAISNIFDNAIRYNVKNGEISINIEKFLDKPYLKIIIKDTGMGIEENDIGKLFSKFFRGENVVKSSSGVGLGLFIAKNIINRHGGEIWAESEINRGSVFYFTLPTDPTLIPPKEIIYGEEF